jgi:phosphoribosylanthranilate isomerase
MVKIKICGVTTIEDTLACALAGADMLGLNFFPRSSRYVEIGAAREICDTLRAELGPACPVLVGVFVNEVVGKISLTMEKVGLNFAQLSGDESGEMLKELRGTAFKAIRPRNRAEALDDASYYLQHASASEKVPSLLLDAHHPTLYGGTGEQASSEVALAVKEKVPRMMLAGGLNPDNVAYTVHEIQPWGVDVASGVENPDEPGKKDIEKVKAFIDAVRSVG